jgi:hypothetical protein
MCSHPTIERVAVSAYTVPTRTPESDGTFEWNRTTLVLVEIFGGGATGLGYSYADIATAQLIQHTLAPKLKPSCVGDGRHVANHGGCNP